MIHGKRLPGDEGVWFFIGADMVLFAMLFGSFSYQRSLAPLAYNNSQLTLEPWIAALNTLFLLTSSWLVARAVVATRSGQTYCARRMVSISILLGVLFVAVKLAEYRWEVSVGANPTSDFFMFYFMVTGIHLLHVIGGIGVLATIRARLRAPAATTDSRVLIESGASFWHMVDLLWLVIFPLFYLLR